MSPFFMSNNLLNLFLALWKGLKGILAKIMTQAIFAFFTKSLNFLLWQKIMTKANFAFFQRFNYV